MEGVSVCPLIVSTTVHPIDFTLGGCLAEDSRKCSVESQECEVVWMSGSRESCKQQHVLSRNCTIELITDVGFLTM